jgi:nicotinamide-nucleotide adenylyltransferase
MTAATTACVTGRFQPLHLDHLRLITEAAGTVDRLIVGITNPRSTSARRDHNAHRHLLGANPFDLAERRQLVEAALAASLPAGVDHAIVPFDLDAPRTWEEAAPLPCLQVVGAKSRWERSKVEMFAAAGYETRLVEEPWVGRFSGSAVRAAIAAGAREEWVGMVPAATVPLLDGFLARRPLAVRTGEA